MYKSINAVKVIFIFVVVVFHSRLLDGYLNHGYLGVEVFFIISGLFMYRSYLKCGSITKYMKNRLKKLYPHYFFSFVIMLIALIAVYGLEKISWKSFVELALVQNLGIIPHAAINYPCWYMSILLWCSAILLLFIEHTERKINSFVLCMLPIMYFGYSFLFEDGRAEIWNNVMGINLCIFRGFEGLAVGIMVDRIHSTIIDKELYEKYHNLWLVEIISFGLMMFCLATTQNVDALFVFCTAIFIICIMSPNSLFERIGNLSVCKGFAKIEYAIFLNHAFIIMLFKEYIIGKCDLRVMYILVLLLVSVSIYSAFTTILIRTVKEHFRV